MPKILAQDIDALLPQTQCGLCGYHGCMPYATALAKNAAPINLCPPGGIHTLKALGTLLEQDPTPYLEEMLKKTKPVMVASIREAECIGCTKCIQVCPVDAILGAAKLMHTVISDECSGCELCLPACPVDCIDMQSIKSQLTMHEHIDPSLNMHEHIDPSLNMHEHIDPSLNMPERVKLSMPERAELSMPERAELSMPERIDPSLNMHERAEQFRTRFDNRNKRLVASASKNETNDTIKNTTIDLIHAATNTIDLAHTATIDHPTTINSTANQSSAIKNQKSTLKEKYNYIQAAISRVKAKKCT